MDAKGLADYMWDVIYWTWINLTLVALFGDWAWWLYLAVPLYSVWALWGTFMAFRRVIDGMMGGGHASPNRPSVTTTSHREMQVEKRGGQRMKNQ